ncbi:MAG: anthranilate synthase component I [Alphaproteobacteria bacterium]|nr:anthranilate synthase component I [Alphaproteobacteria bacterium]
MIAPGPEDFRRAYEAGRPQVVWTTRLGDLDTPVGAALKLGAGKDNLFLFESVEGGAARGRYSIIGLRPDLVWQARGEKAERLSPGRPPSPEPDGTLASLRRLVAESRVAMPKALPRMAAGLFGYMSYDTVRLMERLGEPNPDGLGVPDAVFVRPSVVLVFDGVKDEIAIVTPVYPRADVAAHAAYEAAVQRLAEVADALERPLPHPEPAAELEALPPPSSNTTHEEYLAMVERAKEYIRAGDVFQVVPSQRFSVPFALPPFALYRALRRINPSPYLFYLTFAGHAVVGSSPEILVKVEDGKVTVRPIAGTRPRGASREEDEALKAELLADPKEHAEHLMLLDLGRNDVGRVAEIGTVRVTESFTIEEYSHVMHIVSNVEGRLKAGEDALSALIAGFPAGTVSGAPKVRAMEIIDELEKEKRCVYAGAVGYFAADGSMNTCIALRTALVKDGRLYVQAGGGVVADSVPEAEYQETVNKAKALFRAAEEAVRFATEHRRSQWPQRS